MLQGGISVIMGCVGCHVSGAKLDDPAMLVKNNPLARSVDEARREQIEMANMKKLRCDARHRECPKSGEIYSAIMDTRYGG